MASFRAIRGACLLAAAAVSLPAAGCSYLANEHGQAVSLRTYDCVVVDSVQLDAPAGQEWSGPALAEALRRRLEASGMWETPGMRAEARTLRLHLKLRELRMAGADRPCQKCRRCFASCQVVAYDAATGRLVGSAEPAACCASRGGASRKACPAAGTGSACNCSGRDHFASAVLDPLAGKIVQALANGKGCSPKWESGTMGCGC